MGSSIERSNALHRTYAPADEVAVQNVDEARLRGRRKLRVVNISSTGSMPSGLSRLPSVTKIILGKLSRLLVNTLAPHLGQKFRSRPLPDRAI
jgi:hypothetical protein